MRKRGWGWAAMLCLAAGNAAALGDRPWSDVEAITAGKHATYDGPMQTMHLGDDGTLAIVLNPAEMPTHGDDDEAPPFDLKLMPASLGRHEIQGAWRIFTTEHLAFRDAAAREAYKAFVIDEYGLEDEAQFDEMLDRMAKAAQSLRLLRVPYRSGELLLAEPMLTGLAKAWDGRGPLKLTAVAWRLPPAEVPAAENGFPVFEIRNPLAAGLPIELSGLLRRDAIEGRIVDFVVAPEDLVWKFHRAKVRVRIDRGANHGMYEGMDVYGLPPDEGFFAQVSEVKPEEAIAEFTVSRFSPKHAPTLAGPGVRITTRREHGSTGCPIDTSAAVRGKVLTAAPTPDALAWDADGFAWFDLTIDQGSRDGLAVGDTLESESDDDFGRGLVTQALPQSAVVTWRVQRFDDDQPVTLPTPGDALVTPAWRRLEWETFGDTDDAENDDADG